MYFTGDYEMQDIKLPLKKTTDHSYTVLDTNEG